MVQKFPWDESIITGVPLIDIQHKELIVAFNDLADAIEQGKGASNVKKLLAFLKYYAGWHFEREEKCAEKYRCPIAAVNKQAHNRFIEIFEQLEEQYRHSGFSDELALRIHEELANWIVNHIKRIDIQIGECVHKGENA